MLCGGQLCMSNTAQAGNGLGLPSPCPLGKQLPVLLAGSSSLMRLRWVSGSELWIRPLLSLAVPVHALTVLNPARVPAPCIHLVQGQDGVLAPLSPW